MSDGMTNEYVGAYADIRWNDSGHIQKDYYFSFETLPEDFELGEYVLPLSGVREDLVFYFCESKSELLGMVNPHDHLSEFTVMEITEWVKERVETRA
jgi:hypothetical protein